MTRFRVEAKGSIRGFRNSVDFTKSFFIFYSISCCPHMAKSCGKMRIALIIPSMNLGLQLSLFHVMAWKEIRNGFMIENP